jgi:LuxR family transcriptional regulator, quorum-sensing system regulator BjaR1
VNRAQFAFDSILDIERAPDSCALLGTIHRASSNFGLTSFCIAGIPALDPFDALLHNWPSGWIERYLSNEYVRSDPVIRKLRRTAEPFLWSEAAYPRNDATAHRVMNEATEFRLNDGLCVPIYTNARDHAGVSFASDQLDLAQEDRAALQLIAIYAYSKARDILRPGPSIEIEPPHLTRRELEILKHCSDGATSRKIGDALSISDETVQTHVANAARKLNVSNRCAAVAAALRLRLIS